MSSYVPRVSNSWNLFTYFNFGVAVFMMTAGIYSLEASFSAKGFYAMATIMLVYSTASITKALRDKEEAERMINKIEDARTERLLAEVTARD
ncbi:MAG: YiaA/YiaB family inner membrane protein [Paracoccaceae bacterium]